MITLTGGGVTLMVNDVDAPFYMRLGYVLVDNHETHEPHEQEQGQGQVPKLDREALKKIIETHEQGGGAAVSLPPVPTEPLPASPLSNGEESKKRKKK